MRINYRRWGVFNLVGLAGFVVQIAALALLTRWLEWPAPIATAVALEVAALQNFVGHSRWTWRDRPVTSAVEGPTSPNIRGWLRRYWRYQAAKTASLAANLAITTLIVEGGLPPEVANTAAVLLCAVPNFLVAEHLVFRPS